MKLKKLQHGFTLVEVITGVIITSIAAMAIMKGVSSSASSLKSIRIKEKAFEELKIWTDDWKSKIAGGVHVNPGQYPPFGKTITLITNEDNETVITGRLFRDIRKSRDSGEYSEFYQIKTWIDWEDMTSGKEVSKNLEFITYQLALK